MTPEAEDLLKQNYLGGFSKDAASYQATLWLTNGKKTVVGYHAYGKRSFKYLDKTKMNTFKW